MKKLIILFTLLSIIACKEKHGDTIIGVQFKDHKELNKLADFDKVSDTIFWNDVSETDFGLLHLNAGKKDLIIFASIWNDSGNIRNYKVLDTLALSNLDEKERLTIGYCEVDIKNQNNGNIIALVENPNPENMFIHKIKDAWVARPNSEKIEKLNNIDEVDCINSWYKGEETKINYDLLND